MRNPYSWTKQANMLILESTWDDLVAVSLWMRQWLLDSLILHIESTEALVVWATRIVQQWRLDVYSILFASFCSWVVKGLLNMFHDSFCSFDFYILRRHQSAGRWQLQEYGHLHSCSCTCSLAGFLCEVACQFAFWNFYAILDDRHQEGHKCEWAAAAAYDTGIVRWHGCSYCRW